MLRYDIARRFALAIALAGLAGCSGPGTGGSGTTGTTGAATSSTGGGGTTFVPVDECMASEDCESTGACVAAYDPAATDGSPGRGPSACLDVCIEQDDLTRWCFDDLSCCEGLRCNMVDGFCLPLPTFGSSSSSGSGSSGGSGSGSSGGSSSGGATTSGTTGSGSSGGSTSSGG